MAGQLQETYSDLESKVKERTRDLAQSINELKVLEEVGRAVASSLDLNAVLPTVAARALEITHADAVLIYGYDADKHQFNLTEADRHRQDRPKARISRSTQDDSLLGEAAAKRRADRDCRSRRGRRSSAARRRGRRRLPFGAGGAAGRPAGHARLAGGAAPERRRVLAEPDRPDADLRAPIGAGDAQCAAVHRSRPQEPRAGDRARHRAAAGRQAAGADRAAEGLEQVAGRAGRDPARRDRAHPPARAFPRAAGRAADRLLRRPRGAARQPPPRSHRGVLRPARLHGFHREHRAGRGDERAARISRRARRTDLPLRRHARPLCRRRRDDPVQRADPVRRPHRSAR